jgi:hypothetical protein
MLIAAWAVEAQTCFIYMRDEYPAVLEILRREIAALETADLNVFSATQVRAITTAGIEALGTAQIEALSGDALAALTTAQAQALSTAQVRAIEAADLAQFGTEEVPRATYKRLLAAAVDVPARFRKDVEDAAVLAEVERLRPEA